MAEAKIFEPSIHDAMIADFATIQIACIESDKMVADYIPPLDHDKMKKWWAEKAAQAAAENPTRHIIFVEDNGRAVGVVMLQQNATETGGFRGEVQKLMVSPQHRQKKIARRMMHKLEEVARAQGITLLLLDTEKDSPADFVYPKWGYQLYGTIPQYEKRPDGGLIDGTFYYKNLSASHAISLR